MRTRTMLDATRSLPRSARDRARSSILAALLLAWCASGALGCNPEAQPPQNATRVADPTAFARGAQPREDPFQAVRAARSVRELSRFITDKDVDVRRAAALRLGELGGPESVEALGDMFRREPRSAGTDIGAGVRADVVSALARLNAPDARASLVGALQSWLRDGPMVTGNYAHIYDKQYFAVAVAAIRALEPYDDGETRAMVRAIADDSSLFYALREAAWRTWLRQEMSRKGLTAPAERAAFLANQIDPDGVLIEERWTGKKPGDKTNPAAREAVVEKMILELGWQAAEPLQAVLRDNPAGDPRRTIAAARMVADLALLEFRTTRGGKPEARHRTAVLTAASALSALPPQALPPETAASVFGQLAAAGEGLDAEEVWRALRDLAPKIAAPGAWSGAPPAPAEIGVALPPGLTFVPEYSRRVDGPRGELVEAWYLAHGPAAELVSRLETATGKTAVKQERDPDAAIETVWTIELQPAPPEFAGILAFGVTVRERAGGYRQRFLGRTVREGSVLVCARRILPARN